MTVNVSRGRDRGDRDCHATAQAMEAVRVMRGTPAAESPRRRRRLRGELRVRDLDTSLEVPWGPAPDRASGWVTERSCRAGRPLGRAPATRRRCCSPSHNLVIALRARQRTLASSRHGSARRCGPAQERLVGPTRKRSFKFRRVTAIRFGDMTCENWSCS